ncbi:4'-phosphopantetheinyl transferase family protein [Belliella kenyensis]|uniref:4'-phosphopantetheinyl transferase family protein n=1 Tax=Belliella kenyensis TaxID=1472724 RepID=A0ABV8EGB9_9BACT|nr:4'-phosphopantetheinyl transferase superfamily protein [Belliella kenyensis]MCH7401093.1 4'-phosphopantetheinyl transferase superfamily protein [Belliella kenyensis]MDN3604090.1 4'-phosphopantetheinyl transferase superfamily protein [Belliella kenyensis]
MQTKIEKISALSALAVNNIQEVATQEVDFLSFRERLALSNISREEKRYEWKAARIALKAALDEISLPYAGFFKDEHGKSYPMDGLGFVSLTHTKGVAAAIFHKNMPVGIDLDYVREKVVKLGPKFLDPCEMAFLQSDPLLYTMAWSAKESIFKCQGKKGISLREHILLEPFSKGDHIISGKIYQTEYSDHHYQVKIEVSGDMVLSYTVW